MGLPARTHDEEESVRRFLAEPSAYGLEDATVEHFETHGADVYLAGERAYKIKKPVHFDYMDFSTADKRRTALERELEINRINAPGLYIDVVPVTRTANGRLGLGGDGEAVDWVLRMNRFAQSDMLSAVNAAGGLTGDLAAALADTVAASHRKAPVLTDPDAAARTLRIVRQLQDVFVGEGPACSAEDAKRFRTLLDEHFAAAKKCLNLRGRRGRVRHCHGDLHLRNIVLVDGRPTLFDALEFDEELATTDVLYDLAFLLMDLDENGNRAAANTVFNRYIASGGETIDLLGLKAMPLFLACRAAIRAMVELTRAEQSGGPAGDAAVYFRSALGYLSPPAPRLVAIGGLSGTGKSTLARALAPHLGGCPGAVVLRSDVERKALYGVAETEKLGEAAYDPAITAEVYSRLAHKAGIVLKSGHGVICDAVYSTAGERRQIERTAERAGAAFHGYWLHADADTMRERVANRRGDASDATVEVVDRQISRGTGPVAWTPVEAGGSEGRALAAVMADLGLQKT